MLDTLATLDAQLLEVTEEDQLEAEIEQADGVREKITLCLIWNEPLRLRPNRLQPRLPLPPWWRMASLVTVAARLIRLLMSLTLLKNHPFETVTPTGEVEEGRSTAKPVGSAPGVKLPKLTIKKFSGDLTKWVTFWDSFESAIHLNRSLSDVDKFNYLRESTAADAIAGLSLTSANYAKAVDTLKKRFGNNQS